jgi:hypothetical protein
VARRHGPGQRRVCPASGIPAIPGIELQIHHSIVPYPARQVYMTSGSAFHRAVSTSR